MRVACLFDVHGNLPALEAVLAEVETIGVDLVVSGGDVVSGPMPRATLERLLALGDRVRFVRGNADREAAAGTLSGDASVDAITRYAAADLGADARRLVGSWPERLTLEVDGLGAVLACHATPRSDEEIVTRLTPAERLAAILAGVAEPVVVAGHTHSQLERRVGRVRFVNAGSVGMPYESEPGAYWALLGPEVELRRTEYDLEAAAGRIRASGLPDADRFAAEHVLSPHPPDEAARHFERVAAERDQSANSEK